MCPDDKFEQLVSLAMQDHEKATEIVAKSFYRILKKNEFSNEQIISIATNILDCLIQSLDGYKEKSERNKVYGRANRHVGKD